MRQPPSELTVEDREIVVHVGRMEARGFRWAIALAALVALTVCAGMAGPRARDHTAPAPTPHHVSTPAGQLLPFADL